MHIICTIHGTPCILHACMPNVCLCHAAQHRRLLSTTLSPCCETLHALSRCLPAPAPHRLSTQGTQLKFGTIHTRLRSTVLVSSRPRGDDRCPLHAMCRQGTWPGLSTHAAPVRFTLSPSSALAREGGGGVTLELREDINCCYFVRHHHDKILTSLVVKSVKSRISLTFLSLL